MPSTIIDNDAAGYTAVGTWTLDSAAGYGGSLRYHAAGSGTEKARWTFTGLTASVARTISLTWPAQSNRATNVPWTVYDSDNTTVLGSGTIDQEQTPADFQDSGVGWKLLGGFTPTGTSLRVEITDNANEFVIADAAREGDPTMSASPAYIEKGQAGGVAVTVTGAGTAWTPGTPGTPTFGVSGVSGCSISAQVVNSATSATLTVVTGSAVGTLTITDGTINTTVRVVAATPSGTYEFVYGANSSATSGAGFSTSVADSYDGNSATSFISTASSNGWVAVDLGSGLAAELTKVWLIPRNADGQEERAIDGVIEGGNTEGGAWTQVGTIDHYPFVFQWNPIVCNTSSTNYRYYRWRSTVEYTEAAELRWEGTRSGQVGIRWRPARPALSPSSSRKASGQTVTITCGTSGASIYYTTDGTDPDNTDTLYSTPISLSDTTGTNTTTVKAIAYHADADSTYSEIVTGIYVVPARYVPDTNAGGFGANTAPQDWFDTRGIRLEVHGGHVLFNPPNDTYYWYGNYGGTADEDETRGVYCYSSTDLYNWAFEGMILDNPPGAWSLPSTTRAHVVYNATATDSNKKYVLWAHVDNLSYTAAEAGYATSPAPTGPWTWGDHSQPNSLESRDCSLFTDDNGDVWFVFDSGNHANITAGLLDPATDLTTFEGTFVTLDSTTNREAPVLFKRGLQYFLLSSALSAYFAGNTANQYKTATTLSGLDAAGWTTIWSPASADGEVKHEAQPTCVFEVNGRTDARIFVCDWWAVGASAAADTIIYNARSLWWPMAPAHFPTESTIVMDGPETWDLDDLPAPDVSGATLRWRGTTGGILAMSGGIA